MLIRKGNILNAILICFLSILNLEKYPIFLNIFELKVLAENISSSNDNNFHKNINLNPLKFRKQLGNKVGKFIPSYQPTNESSIYQFAIGKNKVIKTKPIEHNKIKQVLEKKFNPIIYQLNNSGLVIRQDVPVVFKDCGNPNAYWNSKDQIIIICYENMAYDLALFQIIGEYSPEEAFDKSVNETIFAFYHELGHALIDLLPLAAVGQEEDTVDEFAAITLLKTNQPENARIVLDGAEFYRLKDGQAVWWDEHTPDLKRVFNIVCFVYGSNPDKYAEEFAETFLFVNHEGKQISKEMIQRRALLCQQDYQEKLVKWDKLMIPHYTKKNGHNSTTGSHHNPSSPPVNGSSRRGTFW